MIQIGVVGATGYAGAELIRLVLAHPRCELKQVVTRSQIGTRLDALHPGLLGLSDCVTTGFNAESLAKLDAVFVAVPHSKAAPLCDELSKAGAKVILDLSRDHRHVDGWVYGLAEWNAKQLFDATRIAVPGCFATAIAMASAPFVAKCELDGAPRVVAATGSTGLGATPAKGGHHPERFTNLKAYKVLGHQHAPEINTFLSGLAGIDPIRFVPLSAPIDRGILATVMLPMSRPYSQQEAESILEQAYGHHPLVRIREGSPEIRHIRGTSFCDISVFVDGNDVVVISAIDNLGKGASTQAVQCLNHAFDWPVETGLLNAPTLP